MYSVNYMEVLIISIQTYALNRCGLKKPVVIQIEMDGSPFLDIHPRNINIICKQKAHIKIKDILIVIIVMKHIFYHLTAIMVVAVWGMTFISTKVLIVHGLSPQEIFFFRFLLAYIVVCPISSHCLFARNLKDELCLMGGGVLGGSLFFFLQNMALGLTQASNVSFIICTAPLLTAVLTVSVRMEKVSRGFICGSVVALLGVGLLIFNGTFILRISLLGDLLTFLASLSWAFYSLVIQDLIRKYSPAFITRKIFFYGIITILPTLLFLPSLAEPAVLLDSEVWSNLLFLGVIASSACYLLWNIVLGHISGYQKLPPPPRKYCFKKATGLNSVLFIIIIICRLQLVIKLKFKQYFSFYFYQASAPFCLFLNETIDNHMFG